LPELIREFPELGLALRGCVAGRPQEHLPAVLDLASDAAPGDGEAAGRVSVGEVLSVAEQHVAVDLPADTGKEPA
jgi:hypothetical protein